MKTLLTLILLSATLKAFAHGEDKLGPNGGYLKMPGNFHTEVVPEKNGNFRVYLLDINFKNPQVKNSKITASISSGTTKNLSCSPKRDHFLCKTAKTELDKGTLVISAERSAIKGTEAVYTLPLTLEKTNSEKKADDHGSHH